jgi:pimeloyl-ACP methyl ester carboxylesterase
MLQIPSSGGVRVVVHDFGGEGPPLVLAHATGFHGLVWRPVAQRLRDRFRCVAFDARAHGDATVPPDGNLAWEGFADDVLAVVDALGLDRPFGAGHSSGGAALLLAEEARPGTFAALWCYEPIVLPVDPPIGRQDDNPLSLGAERRRAWFPSREDAYANFAAKAPFDRLHPEALAAYVEHGFADDPAGGVRLKCQPAHEAEVYRMMGEHRAFAGFGTIGCPVTLVCGSETDAIGPRVIEAQAAALPHARTEVLDGLGHFGPLEDPDRVAASIARALLGPG